MRSSQPLLMQEEGFRVVLAAGKYALWVTDGQKTHLGCPHTWGVSLPFGDNSLDSSVESPLPSSQPVGGTGLVAPDPWGEHMTQAWTMRAPYSEHRGWVWSGRGLNPGP